MTTNVLKLTDFRSAPDPVEPDHEPDAFTDIGYGRRREESPPGTDGVKDEWDDEPFGPVGPVRPRPPGWRPPVDPEEDLPF